MANPIRALRALATQRSVDAPNARSRAKPPVGFGRGFDLEASAFSPRRERRRGFELSLVPGQSGRWQIFLELAGGGKGRYRDFWLGPLCITLNGAWFAGYPRLDRSGVPRNFVRVARDDVVDLGWCEGALRDGRSYVGELWTRGEVTCLTLFFSQRSLRDLTDDTAARRLEREGLVRFHKRYCSVRRFTDALGNKFWSVNVVLGNPSETFVDVCLSFQPYPEAPLSGAIASRALN